MPDVMTTLRATRAALAHAALLPLVVAMAINLIGRIFARAWRSHLLLRGLPEGKVRFGELLGLLAAGYAAGMVLWGPAEEVLSTTLLARRYGFRWRALLATQVLDKSLGVLSVALWGVAIWSGAATLHRLIGGLAAVAVIVAAGLAVRAARSTSTTRSRRDLAGAFAWMLISNALNIVMIGLSARAVGVPLDATTSIEIFVVLVSASALPIVPGQLGIAEAIFVLVLGHAGVAAPTAIAIALLYRVAQLVPVLLAGVPALLWTRRSSRVA